MRGEVRRASAVPADFLLFFDELMRLPHNVCHDFVSHCALSADDETRARCWVEMDASMAMAPLWTLATLRIVTPSLTDGDGRVWLLNHVRAPSVAHLPSDALAAETFRFMPAHSINSLTSLSIAAAIKAPALSRLRRRSFGLKYCLSHSHHASASFSSMSYMA